MPERLKPIKVSDIKYHQITRYYNKSNYALLKKSVLACFLKWYISFKSTRFIFLVKIKLFHFFHKFFLGFCLIFPNALIENTFAKIKPRFLQIFSKCYCLDYLTILLNVNSIQSMTYNIHAFSVIQIY